MEKRKVFGGIRDKAGIFAKGVLVGGTMTIPGVSGGTMAILLGIYEPLLGALSHMRKEFRSSAVLLLVFGMGAASGILGFSGALLTCMERYPAVTACFFMGAVAGGIPSLLKKGERNLWALLGGGAGVLLLEQIPGDLLALKGSGPTGILLQIAAGFLVAAALILPGISVSQTLVLLGIYEPFFQALRTGRLLTVLPLAVGTVGGIFALAGLLEKALLRYPRYMYSMILGFVAASLGQLCRDGFLPYAGAMAREGSIDPAAPILWVGGFLGGFLMLQALEQYGIRKDCMQRA